MPKQIETSWVDLIEWDPISKSGFTAVRAFLENGEVVLDGDKILTEKLALGIDDVQPADGILFLEAMVRSFRNPYLLATQIRSGVMPKDFGIVEMQIVHVE